MGCLKGFEVSIPVPRDVDPIFFKPRSVPFALKDRVDIELDKLESRHLEESGIFQVGSSNSACS